MIPGRIVLSLGLAVLAAGATLGSAGARQDVTATRQIDLTLTQGTSMAAAASPDGQSIAIDLLGAIWILPFRGGEAKRITPELLEARQPTWSPDSQSIAFQGYEDGAWHIYVIARDGGDAKAITSGPFDDREPAWSHDGSRIAFSSDRYGGITTIWKSRSPPARCSRISTRDGWMPAWSPDDHDSRSSRSTATGKVPGIRCPRSRHCSRARTDATGSCCRSNATVLSTRRRQPRRGAPTALKSRMSPARNALHRQTSNRRRPGGRVSRRESADAAHDDVFPFKPQWLSSTEILYTANGNIMRGAKSPD